MSVLETKNLGIAFGGLQALQDVHFSINKGEIIGLIGPNGAGKTTVFNLLTDVYLPSEGVIELDGDNIVGKKHIRLRRTELQELFRIFVCLRTYPSLTT